MTVFVFLKSTLWAICRWYAVHCFTRRRKQWHGQLPYAFYAGRVLRKKGRHTVKVNCRCNTYTHARAHTHTQTHTHTHTQSATCLYICTSCSLSACLSVCLSVSVYLSLSLAFTTLSHGPKTGGKTVWLLLHTRKHIKFLLRLKSYFFFFLSRLGCYYCVEVYIQTGPLE